MTQNKEAKQLSNELFGFIEQYGFDKENGGYFEAFSRDWQLLDDLRLSDKDANEAKTMNTHLHILEAYTNLYRIEKSELVRLALKRLIDCFIDKFIDKKTHHLKLFFDEKWNLKSNEISFGHDIECSWLLFEAAEVLGEQALIEQLKVLALNMATATLKEGLDQDGAVFNEKNGEYLDTDKHWWPQAEAVVGFWNAYRLSDKEQFKYAALACWSFIQQYLKDEEQGEWHWRVNQQGIPILSEDKAGAWKAPYHNGRMCMEISSPKGTQSAVCVKKSTIFITE